MTHQAEVLFKIYKRGKYNRDSLNSVVSELPFFPVEASVDIVALLDRVGGAQRDIVAVPPLEY